MFCSTKIATTGVGNASILYIEKKNWDAGWKPMLGKLARVCRTGVSTKSRLNILRRPRDHSMMLVLDTLAKSNSTGLTDSQSKVGQCFAGGAGRMRNSVSSTFSFLEIIENPLIFNVNLIAFSVEPYCFFQRRAQPKIVGFTLEIIQNPLILRWTLQLFSRGAPGHKKMTFLWKSLKIHHCWERTLQFFSRGAGPWTIFFFLQHIAEGLLNTRRRVSDRPSWFLTSKTPARKWKKVWIFFFCITRNWEL